jgi:hypothetical protein
MAAAYFDLEVTQKARLFAFSKINLCWIRQIFSVDPIGVFKIAINCPFNYVFTPFLPMGAV